MLLHSAEAGEHVRAAAIRQLKSLLAQLIKPVLFSALVIEVAVGAELVDAVDVAGAGTMDVTEEVGAACAVLAFSAAICGK